MDQGLPPPGERTENLHDREADEADGDGGESVANGCVIGRGRRAAAASAALGEQDGQRDEARFEDEVMFHG